MRVEVVGTSRRPPWPLWAVACVLLWAALVGSGILLAGHTGHPVELCMFRRLTGLPCPTCGITRGLLNLLRGRVAAAWWSNPLVFVVELALAAVFLLRVVFGLRPSVQLTRGERRLAWGCAAVLFLANWAYVIRCVG
jgi:hypothetical protein